MASQIPTRRREQVKAREMGQCIRCGAKGAQWHHRRTRRVVDFHQHCSCNGVWLCPTCHTWAHAHPFEARGEGLVVSRYTSHPGGVNVKSYFGEIILGCTGLFDIPAEGEEQFA